MGKTDLTAVGVPISKYRAAKIKLLQKDFRVNVTEEERAHIETLESEIAVDRYCRTILKNRWKC